MRNLEAAPLQFVHKQPDRGQKRSHREDLSMLTQKNTTIWTVFALLGAQLAVIGMAILVGHFL